MITFDHKGGGVHRRPRNDHAQMAHDLRERFGGLPNDHARSQRGM